MTLHTRQHGLTIGAVFLYRVIFVIERYLTILIRLAVFSEHNFPGLGLALFLLKHYHANTAKRQNQGQKYFHRRNLKYRFCCVSILFTYCGMRKVGPE